MKIKYKSQIDCMSLSTKLRILGVLHNIIIGFNSKGNQIYGISIFGEIIDRFTLSIIKKHGDIK